MREVCQVCGGWVGQGIDLASWPTRRDAFKKLHAHPDAPQVYKWPGSDAERDAFDAALATAGVLHTGSAPLGGRMLVFYGKKGATEVRLVARRPEDL